MEKRIKEIRKANHLTQQEFADRISITRSAIASYEIGERVPSNAVIELICREFRVREEWLRNGEGEMRKPEVTDALSGLVAERNLSARERILIEKFLELPRGTRATFLDYLEAVVAAFREDETVREYEIEGMAAHNEPGGETDEPDDAEAAVLDVLRKRKKPE